MPKQDNRRRVVCHQERSLLNSPMRAVCVHEVSPMSESALKVIGVVNNNGGVPALRVGMAAQPPKPLEAEPPAAA